MKLNYDNGWREIVDILLEDNKELKDKLDDKVYEEMHREDARRYWIDGEGCRHEYPKDVEEKARASKFSKASSYLNKDELESRLRMSEPSIEELLDKCGLIDVSIMSGYVKVSTIHGSEARGINVREALASFVDKYV